MKLTSNQLFIQKDGIPWRYEVADSELANILKENGVEFTDALPETFFVHRVHSNFFCVEVTGPIPKDPFCVCLSAFRGNYGTWLCADYVDDKRVKAIHKDLTQSDNKTYTFTFEFKNGYDISFMLESKKDNGPYPERHEHVFIHNGKCIDSSPAMCMYVDLSPADFFDYVASLPKNAHLFSKYEVYSGRFGEIDYEWAFEQEKTSSKHKIDEIVRKEKEALREIFGSCEPE